MAKHYIYEDTPKTDQLYQGDILGRTPELVALLQTYHKHYADNENYRYFIVLTQSCDLVRRNSERAKGPYITLAAVRPVDVAIIREAKKYQDWWQQPTGIISDKDYSQLHLFLQRLLDNLEANYFYLHEDLSVGISENNCAFLALSVALRVDHYDLCLKAKVAQLKEPFQHKLGWLVGNMYSAIGTPEWDENYSEKDKSRAKTAAQILQHLFVSVSKEQIQTAIKDLIAVKPLTEYGPEQIRERVEQTKIPKKITRFEQAARKALQQLKLIDIMHVYLVNELTNGSQALDVLKEALKAGGALTDDQVDAMASRLLSQMPEILRTKFTDDAFAPRDQVINRIVSAIKTDTIVRSILA